MERASNQFNATRGGFFILFAAMLWGLDGVLRRLLGDISPITIIFLEHLAGAMILLPFAFDAEWFFGVSKRDWGILFILAVFSGIIGTVLFTYALLKTMFISFSAVYLVQKLQPIFTFTAARIVLKEKLPEQFWAYAAVAIIAAYFVTFPGGSINFSTGEGTMIASLAALGAAIAWGSTTAFSKLVLANHSFRKVTALRFFLTTLLAFPLVLLFGHGREIVSISMHDVLAVIAIALSSGMVAILLYYKGLAKTKASISTILELAFPLTAVCIDAFLYHHFLSATQVIAGIILLITMYNLARKSYAAN